ncbi:MAG: Rrf2 family transcriptional regulator [Holophaga sp.]|nr:Rrf2 family transcriptional regulator [Holophaga sp.]
MNFLSASTGYTILALVAMPEDGSYCSVKELSAQLGIPGPFLAKLLKSLAVNGILESVRGPGGGFRLAQSAHRISIGHLMSIVQGSGNSDGCILGLAHCKNKHNPCSLHKPFNDLSEYVENSLNNITIRDLQLSHFWEQKQDMPPSEGKATSSKAAHPLGRNLTS